MKPLFLKRLKIKHFGSALAYKTVLREGAKPTPFYFAFCSLHGFYINYPMGHSLKLYCPDCYPEKAREVDEGPRKFPKNNNRTYRILDEEAYKRFWVGRKPSSKKLFEEWLFDPKATINAISQSHGKENASLISRLNRELVDHGVMDKVKTHAREVENQ